MSSELTHIARDGSVSMVDVSGKDGTERMAIATSGVKFPEEVYSVLKENGFNTKKGSLTQTAILAGIGAVKRTSDLIPLCHNIPITKIDVKVDSEVNPVQITCTVKAIGRTGVEMEALTGASVAGLCIYDMCKALSHDIVVGPTQLIEKTGGKKDFKRE